MQIVSTHTDLTDTYLEKISVPDYRKCIPGLFYVIGNKSLFSWKKSRKPGLRLRCIRKPDMQKAAQK